MQIVRTLLLLFLFNCIDTVYSFNLCYNEMATPWSPKQWNLTKNKKITSFESWKQNLMYTLDPTFAPFLVTGTMWNKKTRAKPLWAFTNELASTTNACIAAQKVAQLELMLGEIANFCPVMSRNTIRKNSTSINNIWQSIQTHKGFQSTGAHFVDLTISRSKQTNNKICTNVLGIHQR